MGNRYGKKRCDVCEHIGFQYRIIHREITLDPLIHGEEKQRLKKELEEAIAERGRAEAQLANESFMSRAPEKMVQVQRDRLARANERITTLEQRLSDLGDA